MKTILVSLVVLVGLVLVLREIYSLTHAPDSTKDSGTTSAPPSDLPATPPEGGAGGTPDKPSEES